MGLYVQSLPRSLFASAFVSSTSCAKLTVQLEPQAGNWSLSSPGVPLLLTGPLPAFLEPRLHLIVYLPSFYQYLLLPANLHTPSPLKIQPGLAYALGQTNQFRTYLIFGDTMGGVKATWERQSYSSAVEVWCAVHRVSVDVIEQSWYFNDPQALCVYQRRLHALRILACALEAQGDTSRFSHLD
ncbi:hypothetical protein C8F04DRAFT_1270110 [Mycena alexandri]|uniref:Uncharacterized protein n=1 Tax=Mycena alexandri TaxID=1745969 RepID=A0AAD6SB30_9AGAR|nr:hypothetical protein C8F04DRAFT_1270105 [Mycena alexandri]KAJ7024571.1 hypothetical protein C8F04DRAFT_1270110 [Mycena alexandri]